MGRMADAVHWVNFGHGSGLDRQTQMPLDKFLLARGKRADTPGLWRVEYLLSNHSSKSITAAT